LNIQSENKEKNTLQLVIEMTPADYQSDYQKQIKQTSKQAALPGFRPGKVPAQLIQAKYGSSILFDLLNKRIGEELDGYVKENNLDLVARPMLIEHSLGTETLKADKNYSFTFDLGLLPDFEIPFAQFPALKQFEVEVTDEDVEDQIKYLSRRYGKKENVDAWDTDELHYISGHLYELGEDGKANPQGYQTHFYVYTDAEKFQSLIKKGLKLKDVLKFDLPAYFESDEEAGIVLQLNPEMIADLKNKNLEFEVFAIEKITPLDRETEFFQTVLNEPNVTPEEGYTKYRELFVRDLENLKVQYLKKQIEDALRSGAQFEFNEEIVMNSLMLDHNIRNVAEFEQKFPNWKEETVLYLIKRKMVKDNPELEVTQKDIRKQVQMDLKQILNIQDEEQTEENTESSENEDENDEFQTPSSEEYLKNLTTRMMKDKEFVNKKWDELAESRIMDFVFSKVTTLSEKVTVKNFFDIINNQN